MPVGASSGDPVRHDITFCGSVQGVGFRMAAQRIAGRHGLKGWIRNKSDGSVRCVIEGQLDTIGEFLADLHESMSGRITGHSITRTPATGEFNEFGIRHH